jgi:glycine betaine/proline transport system permease protein
LFIINQGLWKETIQTLVLVASATAVSMAMGVPLGIWAAHKPSAWRFLQPTLDLMQTMPTFVYLIPVLILFGLGAAPALIVTTVFAMPAPVRMTYLGLTTIPKPMLEAGTSFGATKRQLESRNSRSLAVNHGGANTVYHALAFHGGDCHTDRRAKLGQPCEPRIEQS